MGAITIIVIAAFAIDRLVTGLFFLLSFSADLRPLVSDDVQNRDERSTQARRLLYGIVAGYFGVVVVAGILRVHLFEMTQIAGPGDAKPNALMDTLLTGMILAAGADRLSEMVKTFGGGHPGEKAGGGERPIEITGKIVLEQGSVTPTVRSQNE